MKSLLLSLRDELVKAAEANEKSVQEKCAHLIQAASGLAALREKIGSAPKTPASNSQRAPKKSA